MASCVSPGFHYSAFGLTLRSAFAVPELIEAGGEGPADFDIVLDPIADELPGATTRGVRFQSAPDALLLKVDNVARYLIEGGRRIVVDPCPGADMDEVRVFLLGSAIAALLHQRGDLVLHGSAIVVDGEAALFIGPSGVGKSTTANALRKAGFRMLADDLSVVRPGPDGRMVVFPGFPRTKLWPDSLRMLDVAADGLSRVRAVIEKRTLPFEEDFHDAPAPVRKIYVLSPENRDEIDLIAITGPQKASVLKRETYRFAFLNGIANRGEHFRHVLGLAEQAPLTLIRRPNGQFRLNELAQAIRDDVQP